MSRQYSPVESDSDDDIDTKVMSQAFFDSKLHDILCGKRPIDPSVFLGPQVTHHEGKIPVAPYADEKDVARASQTFRQMFYAYTGRQIMNFKLTKETQRYVSMLTSARSRDRYLCTLLSHPPKIWDLSAGSGADVIFMCENLGAQLIVACQRSVPEEFQSLRPEYDDSLKLYKVMVKNIECYLEARPELKGFITDDGTGSRPADAQLEIRCRHILAEKYISSQQPGTEVDIVYLDPSWDNEYDSLHNARQYELSPKELFDRLEKIIWAPIRARNIKVGIYVIKTRWDWIDVQEFVSIKDEFIAFYSVEAIQFRDEAVIQKDGPYHSAKGLFRYMILVHKNYQTIHERNNQMYWDIVRNGIPVWVKKDSMIGVHKPQYTESFPVPEWTDKQPADVSDYIHIIPPKPFKGHRIIHAYKGPQRRSTYDPSKFFREPSAERA
jgi:hypothetical protein